MNKENERKLKNFINKLKKQGISYEIKPYK